MNGPIYDPSTTSTYLVSSRKLTERGLIFLFLKQNLTQYCQNPVIVSKSYLLCLLLFSGGVLTANSSNLVESAVKNPPEEKKKQRKKYDLLTIHKWTLMPCFGRVTIVLIMSKPFWSGPNYFGQVQIRLFWTIFYDLDLSKTLVLN